MAKLNELHLDANQLGVLLAADKLDAGNLGVGTTGIAPNTTNRTIIIGIGGTGVRTADYVKGVISRRLSAGWQNYVAFLGIDTSWTELDGAKYLDSGEKIMTTLNGVAERMSRPVTYPRAVRPFMFENATLGALDSDGAGRTRLAGKLKIHDQMPGSPGVDQEIVSKIEGIASTFDTLTGPGAYEVYVIGSVSGGTCSGGMLELPALIREALSTKGTVVVNAILYLPDTLSALDPPYKAKIEANGYATLKELNYYMGMYSREGYSESFFYNSGAKPAISLSSRLAVEGFVNIPYLVGAPGGASANSFSIAKETIAEFMISILGNIQSAGGTQFLTTAFLSNAKASDRIQNRAFLEADNTLEAADSDHSFPKRFAAIGFAKATVPEKRVRAFTVSKICKEAGLASVGPETRAGIAAGGDHTGVLPFRNIDCLDDATTGTAEAALIVQPIVDLVNNQIHNGSFAIAGDLNQIGYTYKDIQGGLFERGDITGRANRLVEERTDSAGLQQMVQNAYNRFRNNVCEYVKREGCFAFANLYDGRFLPVAGNQGVGIAQMLSNLANFKGPRGEQKFFTTVEGAAENLTRARAEVNKLSALNIIRKDPVVAAWNQAYTNSWVARINHARHSVAFGPTGYLYTYVQVPAASLKEQIFSFGELLDRLATMYTDLGSSVSDFASFLGSKDSASEVNIAAVNNNSYNWLLQQSANAVNAVNAQRLRDHLVEDFFTNTDAWLRIDEKYYTISKTNTYSLSNPDIAIPARLHFDELMANECPNTLDISISNIFTQLSNTGTSYNRTADDIVNKLIANSRPLVNANLPNNASFLYLVYPSSLSTAVGGPQIIAALQQAINAHAPGTQMYASNDADAIYFYQMSTPWELYLLNNLKDWEAQYEAYLKVTSTYMHGMSPDVSCTAIPGQLPKYEEGIPWKDYPPITRTEGDPRTPDPFTGEVSTEGKIVLRMDAVIAEAKKLGVLYSSFEPNSNKWCIKYVACGKDQNWTINPALLSVGQDGRLPVGKDFMTALMQQSGTTLVAKSKVVKLDSNGGVLGGEMPTEELAWKYAARTLRVHIPMFIQIRNTIEVVRPMQEKIIELNEAKNEQLKARYMANMIQAGIFYADDSGVWSYVDQNDMTRTVANPVLGARFSPDVGKLVNNGLLSYYLFAELGKVMDSCGDSFEEANNRANTIITGMVATNRIDELTKNEEALAKLKGEATVLTAKGARLDTPNPAGLTAPSAPKLINYLSFLSPDEVFKVETFYFNFTK